MRKRYMKYKVRGMIFGGVFLLILIGVLAGRSVQAGAKVKFSLKGGTLTVSGKGNMPKDRKYRNNKKIKKVIVKKGVTSIPDKAFYHCKRLAGVSLPNTVASVGRDAFAGTAMTEIVIPPSVKTMGEGMFLDCKKLKKVTMPGKFKFREWMGDDSSLSLDGLVDTVSFNTALSLKTLIYIRSSNLIVSEKDPNYESIRGVIYSKDKKAIVRMPRERSELVIEEGCEEFCLQSVMWCTLDCEGDVSYGCDKLESIEIPASVRRIDAKRYYCVASQNPCQSGDPSAPKLRIKIHGNSLSQEDLDLLHSELGISYEDLTAASPGVYSNEGGGEMLISEEGELKKYMGTQKVVQIPEQVTKVADYAFYGCKTVEEIRMGDQVTSIGRYAFGYCTSLKKLQLSRNLVSVGDRLTIGCDYLQELVIPGGLRDLSVYGCIFSDCGIRQVELSEGLQKIGMWMFKNCTQLKQLRVPGSVETIEQGAFEESGLTEITIPAGVGLVEDYAFASCPKAMRVVIKNPRTKMELYAFYKTPATLVYECDASQYKTYVIPEKKKLVKRAGKKVVGGKTKKTRAKRKVRLQWCRVEGADGYELKMSPRKNFKKHVSTYRLGKEASSKMVVRTVRGDGEYVKIRPYTVVDGKKVYGKWSTAQFEWEGF